MKRAFALVLASLALAYAQEAAPADPKAAAVHKPSTEAKPEPAAEVKPEEETIQKPRKPMLKVLCAPKSVALNTPFYSTMEYFSEFSRPMAIHLDLLNADTNQWIAGDMVKVTGSAGKVTLRVMVPQEAQGPFKYNAYIAPQDENWPNMIAQTSFDAPLGAKVTDACAPLRNSARTPKQPIDFNYALVKDYPTGFKAGAKTDVMVQYNLVAGSEPTYISAALLKSSDNSVVAVAQAKAEEGEHTARLPLDVPFGATTEPVYIMAMLKPAGKALSERVAEDRVWSTAVYNARRNLRA